MNWRIKRKIIEYYVEVRKGLVEKNTPSHNYDEMTLCINNTIYFMSTVEEVGSIEKT